jgi:CHAT domain-containing protein
MRRILCGLLLSLIARPAAADPPLRPASLADCNAAVRERPVDADAHRCYQILAHRTGQWAAVRRRLESLLARQPGNGRIRLVLGLIEADLAEPRAEARLRSAVETLAAEGDRPAEARARRGLALFLARKGRLDEADAEIVRAAAGAGEDPALRAAVTVAEARAAYHRQEFARAWALYKKVESDWPATPWWIRSELLSGMGATLWAMARFEEGLDCYQRQLELVRAEGDRYEEAAALYNVALLTSRLRNAITPETRRLVQQALDAAVAAGNPGVEVSVRLAMAQDKERDVRARIEQIEKALVILRRTEELDNTCFALRELARNIGLSGGPMERAHRALDEAIDRARAAGSRANVARGLIRRALSFQDHEGRARATPAHLAALDAIERVRDLQSDEQVRARVASDYIFFYWTTVDYLLRPAQGPPSPDEIDLAFQVSERLRARELLDHLDAARATAAFARDHPLQRQRAAVLASLARLQKLLVDPGLPPRERQGHLAELERLEASELELRVRIARSDPVYAALRAPRPPAMAEVRDALAADQALLAFNAAKDWARPWLFLVTRDGARAIQLSGLGDSSQAGIAVFLRLVDRRDGSERDGATRLYRDLLHEALASLPPSVTRLVIVPDGPLHSLPFDALRDPRDGTPVAVRYEITLAPSAALWLRFRSSPAAPVTAALALADPALPRGPARSTFRETAPWVDGLQLGALPRGRDEARLATRLLGGDSRLLMGDAATEHALKTAELGSYALLHIAAHAVTDDERPERSAVVLSPGSPEEDGLLQTREIVGLDLAGKLVVLSACRTSTGLVLGGEGPLSLGRAFLQAGARSVVGTLWPVRDDEAEALIAAFYRRMAEGRTAAAALAAARRERLHAGAPAAAWSGLVLVGDGEIVLRAAPRGTRWGTAALAVGFALVIALAVWMRRRRIPSSEG